MDYDITDDNLGDEYDGCFMYDECLECSEERCISEDHELTRYLRKQRNYFIRLLRCNGFKTKILSSVFSLSKVQIWRIVKGGKK